MFKARIKAEVLKTLLDAIVSLTDEVRMRVTADGISIKAVDPAHVAMVHLSLGKKAFTEFRGADMEMGLDLDKLKEILKLASPQEELQMEYKEESHKLLFKIGNVARRMSLVDTANMGDPNVPNLSWPSQVTVLASEIQQGVRAGSDVSDHVALVADGQVFEMLANGDTDQVHVRLEGDELVKINSPNRSRSAFSLDYFTNMIKVLKANDAMTLHLGQDFPVRIESDFANGAGHIVFLLAPRIETE